MSFNAFSQIQNFGINLVATELDHRHETDGPLGI